MKKILSIALFMITVFLNAQVDGNNFITEIDDNIYSKIFGVWEEEYLKDEVGSPMDFSWGTGEFIKNSSLIIDFLSFENKTDLYFQSLNLYKITEIFRINQNTFKITLLYEYYNEEGILIIHWIDDNIIWFETIAQYNSRINKTGIYDIPYGERCYSHGDVVTGQNNKYYRRVGPDK